MMKSEQDEGIANVKCETIFCGTTQEILVGFKDDHDDHQRSTPFHVCVHICRGKKGAPLLELLVDRLWP